MKIYDIGQQFQGLYDLVESVEYDENGEVVDNSEVLAELFNDLEIELSEKLINTNYIIKELALSEQALKDEAKRLTEKAKVLANRGGYLKDRIKDVIVASGQSSIKTDKFNFNVRVQESYNYDDVNTFGLEREFIKVKEELDKTKIKQFVKAGGVIDGLRIEEKSVLSIR